MSAETRTHEDSILFIEELHPKISIVQGRHNFRRPQPSFLLTVPPAHKIAAFNSYIHCLLQIPMDDREYDTEVSTLIHVARCTVE